jgi:ribosome-binding ATPase YchF (GTP1/OBG family)
MSGAVVGKKASDPVDDFVTMESELAADLCAAVDTALGALKKVSRNKRTIPVWL